MTALEKLKSMVNKPFMYNGHEVVVIGYCDGTGDNGDEVEIYLNNGKTLEWNMTDLIIRLEKFRPVSNTVIVLANERLNQVSTVNHTVINSMRETIMTEIEAIKSDPSRVAQAKQIFQGVNTLVNLAKTELEYRKYMDQNDRSNS